MLICVSANPAIDRRLFVERFAIGEVNRALAVQPRAGGKAAHVATAARALDEEVLWVGFLGGEAGAECERGLAEAGVPVRAIRTGTETRTNLEIIDAGGAVTEVLEPGGEVTAKEVGELLGVCEELFARSGAQTQVALSGSLPPGAPVDLYAQLIRAARAHHCRALLDTSGAALIAGLAAAPDLVKPNRDEAARIMPQPIVEINEMVRELFARGAHSVALSLGAEGMIWGRDRGATLLRGEPPRVAVRSTVGCGDAALAGLAVAYGRRLNDEETVRLAVAAGTANCTAEAPGLIDAREVGEIASRVRVRAA